MKVLNDMIIMKSFDDYDTINLIIMLIMNGIY